MSKPVVHILIGPSGSGKSTWAKAFCEHKVGCAIYVCSADRFHMVQVEEDGYVREVYKFDPSKAAMAHSQCMNEFLKAIASPDIDHVIVDNTNISLWERQNYIQAAFNAGCQLEFEIWLVNTIDEIKLCAKRNVHGVPLGVIADMALRFDFDPEQIPGDRKSYRYHGDRTQTLSFRGPA